MQAVQADTTLSLVQAQHVRQLQEVQERAGDGCREQVELLQVRLMEEQRRSQQLEETLRLQAQQSCSQITTKQVNTEVRGHWISVRELSNMLMLHSLAD